MKKTWKRTFAVLGALALMTAGVGSMTATAANTVVAYQPYQSGSTVYVGSYATNRTNSSTDFLLGADVYDVSTTGTRVYKRTISAREDNVGRNVMVNVRASLPFSNCPSKAEFRTRVSSYVVYNAYAQPYEVSDTYILYFPPKN